jgi:acetyltransferase-like isoleucine patch superfamily enzyme
MGEDSNFKVKTVSSKGGAGGAWRKYRVLNYGELPLAKTLAAELCFAACGSLGGAAGLFLRSKLYPFFLASTGPKVFFGRNVLIRHPQRIRIGEGTIIDDNCVIDAKGETNEGITFGKQVFIGRNTIVYCKNGNIRCGDKVNISTNCQFVASNDMTIGANTVIGAYSYLLSGGGYDFSPGAPPFAEQTGFLTNGPLTIGANCWLGARVTVLDAASLGERCVAAAGAVITKPMPANVVVGGVPAAIIKAI